MSLYEIPDPEDLLECPYDKVHMVRAKRFPYHLMKCRRNYTGQDYAVCPFNARHEMPRPELRYHMANCKDRALLNQDVSYAQMKASGEEEKRMKGNTSVPPCTWQQPPSREDWDSEIPVRPRIGVDPQAWKELSDRGVKNLTGMTPAEKRRYHERLRLNFMRKQQGLPPLQNDEEDMKSEISGPKVRVPKFQEGSQVLQLAMQQKQAREAASKGGEQTDEVPSVFSYSIMAGRGRGIMSTTSMRTPRISESGDNDETENRGITEEMFKEKTTEKNAGLPDTFIRSKPYMTGVKRDDSMDAMAQILQALSRGRGIGRGTPLDSVRPAGLQNNMFNGNMSPLNGLGRGLLTASPTKKDSSMLGGPEFVVPKVEQQEEENLAEKEKKRLQKKLRMIDILEQKQLEGYKLNNDEVAKVGCREEILQQIAGLKVA